MCMGDIPSVGSFFFHRRFSTLVLPIFSSCPVCVLRVCDFSLANLTFMPRSARTNIYRNREQVHEFGVAFGWAFKIS